MLGFPYLISINAFQCQRENIYLKHSSFTVFLTGSRLDKIKQQTEQANPQRTNAEKRARTFVCFLPSLSIPQEDEMRDQHWSCFSPTEVLCGFLKTTEAPGVCQPFPCVLTLQWDLAGSQCHPCFWGAGALHSPEWPESRWEPEGLLPQHCGQQVGVALSRVEETSWVPSPSASMVTHACRRITMSLKWPWLLSKLQAS